MIVTLLALVSVAGVLAADNSWDYMLLVIEYVVALGLVGLVGPCGRGLTGGAGSQVVRCRVRRCLAAMQGARQCERLLAARSVAQPQRHLLCTSPLLCSLVCVWNAGEEEVATDMSGWWRDVCAALVL